MSGNNAINATDAIHAIHAINATDATDATDASQAARHFSADIPTPQQARVARHRMARRCFRLCGGTPERTT